MINHSSFFYFDDKRLLSLGEGASQSYSAAEPFPHIVMDNFLPEEVAEGLLQEFPTPTQIKWYTFKNVEEIKLACNDESQMGPFTRHVISQFNSSVFVTFLEKLTGIPGIVADPHLEGGGLHQIKRTGYLKVHADFNRHSRLNLDRRLNVLLYLNKDWKDEYGGHFQLWNKEMTRCETKVAPLFNRLVVFSTSDYSFHGHPDPLNCPEGMTRKSLAFYYYSNGRPSEEVSNHHDTLFKKRPGETFDSEGKLKTVVKRVTPPIVIDLFRAIRRNSG